MINDIKSQISKDKSFRLNLTQSNFAWFFTTYFGDYIEYEIADFHRKLFEIASDTEIALKVVVAFRGSGKSTILSFAYTIWAILGNHKKKHIIICSNTENQAKLILQNIKAEFEKNKLLIQDYGEFQYSDEAWRADTLILPKYGARISTASVGSSVRGARHGKYRPDLIILDDTENLESVQTKEGRDKVSRWLERDLIPAGDKNTQVIVLGNLLHTDDLINRLIKKIETNQINGKYIKTPLIDDDGEVKWKGKFPDKISIEKEKQRIGDEKAFLREYLLKIIPEDDQLITFDMLNFYEELPEEVYLQNGLITVDLAISKNDSADNTAILCGNIYKVDGKQSLYLLPYFKNNKYNFHEAISETKNLAEIMLTKRTSHIFAENVGYQGAFIETIKADGYYNAKPFEIKGQDKRSRLSTTVHPISTAAVLFPKNGLNELINQLIGFGIEKHDDLADAFSMMVMKFSEIKNQSADFIRVSAKGDIRNIDTRKPRFQSLLSFNTGQDWADREDENLLSSLRKGRKWRRIYG